MALPQKEHFYGKRYNVPKLNCIKLERKMALETFTAVRTAWGWLCYRWDISRHLDVSVNSTLFYSFYTIMIRWFFLLQRIKKMQDKLVHRATVTALIPRRTFFKAKLLCGFFRPWGGPWSFKHGIQHAIILHFLVNFSYFIGRTCFQGSHSDNIAGKWTNFMVGMPFPKSELCFENRVSSTLLSRTPRTSLSWAVSLWFCSDNVVMSILFSRSAWRWDEVWSSRVARRLAMSDWRSATRRSYSSWADSKRRRKWYFSCSNSCNAKRGTVSMQLQKHKQLQKSASVNSFAAGDPANNVWSIRSPRVAEDKKLRETEASVKFEGSEMKRVIPFR